MTSLLIAALAFTTSQSSPNLAEVPYQSVDISGGFWADRQTLNREVTIPHGLDQIVAAGDVGNFERVDAKETGGHKGFVFQDSDVYKMIEAASYSLGKHPDPTLDAQVDDLISKIAKAQMPDGYVDTFYQLGNINERLTNLEDNHEMYCAGHLFEAAVAHYQATGKRSLLDIATKYADFLRNRFGSGPNQRMGYPGHPEIELALVKLAKATGNRNYLDLAKFFIDNRGTHYFAQEHNTPLDRYDGTYWLDEIPIRERQVIAGHAVRACYLMSGATDVAAATGDPELAAALKRIWKDAVDKQMYVTGGVGSTGSGEAFTTDYDLPNLTAYQETCASVAMVLWNHRMNLLFGDAKYADVMERSLYNGVLAGVSLDGKNFFYVNPLESTGGHHRQPWFDCACCPPNAARLIASLGSYAYATGPGSLYVNLFVDGTAKAKVGDEKIDIASKTQYPWDGHVEYKLHPSTSGTWAFHLRIPGWSQGASVTVNGQTVDSPVRKGYFVLNRAWKDGDTVDLTIPLAVRKEVANPEVKDDEGKLALARGPIVYCLEGLDQSAPLDQVFLPIDRNFEAAPGSGLFSGMTVLTGNGAAFKSPATPTLYATAPQVVDAKLTAIPYFAWDNRKPSPMKVWVPEAGTVSGPLTPERQAKVSLSFRNGYGAARGINNGFTPKSSDDMPASLCHWWPHKGTNEWAVYTWDKPMTLNGSQLYWYDDTGHGECRPPSSWVIEYKDGDAWKPVELIGQSKYSTDKNRWNSVSFKPVVTTQLRLSFKCQENWSVGVSQWKVATVEADE